MSNHESGRATPPSLLLRIRDPRDERSWQEFVDVYGPLVYRYVRGRGLQDADAADLTQEVLAEVARCIRGFTYQPERGRFRDWLGTLTRRKLSRFLGRRKDAGVGAGGGAADGDLADCPAGPADAEWTAEFNARLLRAALDRARPHFAPATWLAFERVWFDGKSAAEAAAELGLPIEAVYLAKSRVLKRLEEEILLLAEDLPQFLSPGS